MVFGGGGKVAVDEVAILGALLAGQPPGDLLLDLGGSQVAFGLSKRYLNAGSSQASASILDPWCGPRLSAYSEKATVILCGKDALFCREFPDREFENFELTYLLGLFD